MRKDGIQTRKRKPKKTGSGSAVGAGTGSGTGSTLEAIKECKEEHGKWSMRGSTQDFPRHSSPFAHLQISNPRSAWSAIASVSCTRI